MLLAGGLQSSSLDLPTLSLVAVCIAGLLGLFLIIDWMQQRNVRALAWWGSAYLIGAFAMALGTMPAPFIKLPTAVPGALTFLACGMVWNGVRLFQGRRVLPFATFIGAVLWLGLAQIWLSGSHITQGIVKNNDYYFGGSTYAYNNEAEKLHVICTGLIASSPASIRSGKSGLTPPQQWSITLTGASSFARFHIRSCRGLKNSRYIAGDICGPVCIPRSSPNTITSMYRPTFPRYASSFLR